MLLAWLATPVAPHDQTGAVVALSSDLSIFRISESDAHQAARLPGGIDIRAVNGINVEDYHIAALSRDRNGVFQAVMFHREVRREGRTIRQLGDVGQLAELVRAIQETNLAVCMAGIIKVNQYIHLIPVLMFVKWVVLVHGEGVTGLL